MTKMILCMLGVMLVVTAAAKPTPSRGWRGIVPLRSTRTDVERLLGIPSDKSMSAYSLPEGHVIIFYSQHRCDDGWDVPADTVIGIDISPKPIPLTDLRWDLRKYKKEAGDYDVPDHFYYRNDQRGFSISVRSGVVDGYIYGPTTMDKLRLRCRNLGPRPQRHGKS